MACAISKIGENVMPDQATYVWTQYRLEPRGRPDVRQRARCGSRPRRSHCCRSSPSSPDEVVTKDELFAAVWPETQLWAMRRW